MLLHPSENDSGSPNTARLEVEGARGSGATSQPHRCCSSAAVTAGEIVFRELGAEEEKEDEDKENRCRGRGSSSRQIHQVEITARQCGKTSRSSSLGAGDLLPPPIDKQENMPSSRVSNPNGHQRFQSE
ncbi:hypothetical protein STEG23_008901 [Scotinomys teguina]